MSRYLAKGVFNWNGLVQLQGSGNRPKNAPHQWESFQIWQEIYEYIWIWSPCTLNETDGKKKFHLLQLCLWEAVDNRCSLSTTAVCNRTCSCWLKNRLGSAFVTFHSQPHTCPHVQLCEKKAHFHFKAFYISDPNKTSCAFCMKGELRDVWESGAWHILPSSSWLVCCTNVILGWRGASQSTQV